MDGDHSSQTQGNFEAPKPAELNALLPAYQVSALIACGGMGAVYLAIQKSLDRKVALKILPRELGDNPQFRASFETEAKAMARLHHPNLVAVYDFGEVDDFLYIVMEFVEGKSLFHSAHGKAIEQREVARLVHGICEGLAHAHEAGIIHRDIKPANILLDPRKRPRIGDFGLARGKDAEDDGLHFGSPDYIAPEALKNPSKASKRSDVYSIGVILYELLTGELPAKAIVPPSRTDSDIDRRFDAIVARALHPIATMRYADAEGMALAIGDLNESLENPTAGLLTLASGKEKTTAPKAELLTDDESEPVDVNADASAMSIAAGSRAKRSLHRNLVIIAVLIVSIVAMLTAYNRKKIRIAKDKELAKLEDKTNEEKEAKNPFIKPEGTSSNPPPRPRPRPRTESGDDQPLTLAGLRRSLLNGDRSRFPEGTKELGDGRIFYVETAMSWPEAADFAQAHGGHLLTISDDTELAAAAALVPRSTAMWLGGGTVGADTWGWVDGTDWSLPGKPSLPTGSYLSLTNGGRLQGSRSDKTYPFVIEWRMDGENPGSSETQWARLGDTLLQSSPLFPPGTLAFEKRRYFINEGPATWDDARMSAKKTGGHLVVPSDEAEWNFLKTAISKNLPKDSSVWIGGSYVKGSWSWVTREPWTFSAWTLKPPDELDSEHTAVCVVSDPDGHAWDNADPMDDTLVSGFIIEWSADQNDRATTVPPASPKWKDLRAKTATRLARGQAQFAKTLADNGRNLNISLENWYNKVDKRFRARYYRPIQAARETISPEGRIDETKLGRLPQLPADIGGVCNDYLNRQRKLDTDFESALGTLQENYLKDLRAKRAAAHQQRLFEAFTELDDEIEGCGTDQEDFLEHFKPTP